jgi:glycosyltransferase involved in cell wall biosynthesis
MATGIAAGTASQTQPLILVVSHVIPYPPAAGNEIRILKMLTWLKQRGFGIVLLLNHSPVPAERRLELERLFDYVHFIGDDYGAELRPLSRKPLKWESLYEALSVRLAGTALHLVVFGQDRQSKVKSDGVKKWLASDRLVQVTEYLSRKYCPSAVLCEYIFTAPCLDVVPGDVLKIIDTHDMFSRKKEQVLKYGIDDPLPCSPREERNYLLKADLVIAIQSNEARMFRDLVLERDVITVGIDFDVVREIDHSAEVRGRILVVGSDNPLNIHGLREFYDNAWPQIRSRMPEATLRVVGKLANRLQSEDERVQCAGWVEDLDAEYRRAAVVVNPTVAGTGLKIKSVEALCKGKPLVATVNSVEGIAYDGKAPFVVCEGWNRFAEEVLALLLADEERRALQLRAWQFARENFSAEKVYSGLGGRLQEILASGH